MREKAAGAKSHFGEVCREGQWPEMRHTERLRKRGKVVAVKTDPSKEGPANEGTCLGKMSFTKHNRHQTEVKPCGLYYDLQP